MKGPVLVTGGAGSVGKRVAQKLRKEGYRVRVFDLPGANFSGLEGEEGFEVVKGDLTKVESIEQGVRGAGAVIHLAALLPPASERNRELTFDLNVEAVVRVAKALKQKNPSAPLVFSSSVSTYGDTVRMKPPVTVNSPQQALDIYAESKITAERRLKEAYPDAVILRISGISVPVIQSPPDVWPFMADQRIEFVHRDDVVTALCNAVIKEVKGQVLNIAGGATWRMTGMAYVKDYFDLLGVPLEEARFMEKPGWCDWYDTTTSQRLLNYQNTSYPVYLAQLRAEAEKMFQG